MALALRTTTWEVVYIVGPSRETKVGGTDRDSCRSPGVGDCVQSGEM